MLAAHEPSADPRVDWEAAHAAQRFEVLVVGLDEGHRPSAEHAYRVRRLRRRGGRMLVGIAYLLLLVAGMWHDGRLRSAGRRFVATSMRRPGGRLMGALTGLVLFPVLLVAEGVVRGLGALRVLAPRGSVRLALRALTLIGEREEGEPPSLVTRLLSFAWTLKHVFSVSDIFLGELRNTWPRPAIVHANDLDTLLAAVLFSRETGVPVLFDSHENCPWVDVYSPPLQVAFFCWMQRRLLSDVDEVVTVSDPLADVLRREFGVASVSVLPNVEPWRGSPEGVVGPMSAFAAGRLKVLYQGSFAPRRGLEEIIDAWEGVDARRAALFLRGPDNACRRALAHRAEQAGLLGTSVYLLDPVTEAQLVPAASEADVGLVPYRSDLPAYVVACPNKLSQYMHAGLVVLSVDLPYVAGVLQRSGAGYVFAFADSPRLVNLVHWMADDHEALAQTRARSLEFARETFNWRHYAPVLDAAYARLVPDVGSTKGP